MFRLFRNNDAGDEPRLTDANGELIDPPEVELEDEGETADSGEGEGESEKFDLDAELAREAEEFGLANSDPKTLYGPNGEDVASVIEALTTLDDDTADALAEAYWAAPAADRRVAKSVVRRLRRQSSLDSEMWAAEQAVADWLAGVDFDDERQDTYGVAADAATDAVDALILGDELADVDFSTLYGPWSDVMDSDEGEDGEGEADAGAPEGAAEGEGDDAEGSEEEGDEGSEEEGEFGPNTDLVKALFARLESVEPSEISALVGTWRTQPKEDLRVAHRDLQSLADGSKEWRRQLQHAQDEVLAWINGESLRAESRAVPVSVGGPREVAGPVIADAVSALVMADMLEAEEARTLYAPWAEVLKTPALPEFDEDDDESGGEAEDD